MFLISISFDSGADVNKTSRNNDETVLSAACCSGDLQIVQLLLKNGASPHFRLQVEYELNFIIQTIN